MNPKVPPHNIEAEQSVLGAILMEESNIARAEELLSPDDFYRGAHKEIYQCMLDLHNERKPIDTVTLINSLRNRGVLDKIGGAGYLSELIEMVPINRNYIEYCQIVHEKGVIRNLIHTATQILEDSYGSYDNVGDLVDRAEQEIFKVSQGRRTGDFQSIQETLGTTLSQIEAIESNKGKLTGIETGFAELNHITSGLQPSDLIIVAARPSMGKTAFALNIAQNAAIKDNRSVAIFSLEMAKEQLVQRMLCAASLVDSNNVRTGNLSKEDWERIVVGYNTLFGASIFIDDTPGISISEIRSKCRRLKTEKALDLIVIDYLQLMGGGGRSENRQNEISEMSRGLKALAREMEAPVIALSQLSRAPDARTDHHPVMSDLRESGSIEQDADVIMLLFREYYYEKNPEIKNIAEVNIAKQRNGPTGTIRLAWIPEYTKFNDLAIGFNEDEYGPDAFA
ncbi:replicative DNA helicase [Acetobacterium fimetarium]|uniref:Replicative DNA helicase n=1 Tax=Acetobacterium fimetarium TaxID=52691 RepID=A0ABR6WX89_9FIRM|nr:replicative DNA helicase [Acetobacterium fimetarium]MBC3804854.1 replicative DNA helicase [Acetobacterium fimetarium]